MYISNKESLSWSVHQKAVEPAVEIDVRSRSWAVLKDDRTLLGRLGFTWTRDERVDPDRVRVSFAKVPAIFVDRSVREVRRMSFSALSHA